MNRRDFIGAIASSTAVLPASGEQAVVWGEDLMRLGISGSRVESIEARD
jgi:hypothetical protein